MDERSRSAEAQVHATNLEYTLKELQRKVREHEAELDKVSRAARKTCFERTTRPNILLTLVS